MAIKPIPTRYKGHHFRSRLEARWAVLLDHLDIEWRYEDQGYELEGSGYYLPDFWLPSVSTFLEVKPDRPSCGSAEEKKFRDLAEQSGFCCVWALEIPDTTRLELYDVMSPHGVSGSWECLQPLESPVSKSLRPWQGAGFADEITCPACGSDYCDIVDVRWNPAGEYSSALGYRGPGTVRIEYTSENCDHRFFHEIAFHKGNTYITAYLHASDGWNYLEWILYRERTPEQRRAAAQAARSARFEHGQSGAT